VKLKLDENIPQSAATRLAALGYDVDTVLAEQRCMVVATLRKVRVVRGAIAQR
jgi:hypothetical protein